MAVVYLAEHLHLGRKEAIKVLSPELARSSEFIARFRREARATNRLQHRNIVSVYDFGQLPDGRFYLAMEYADGESLKAVLRKANAFPVSRAVPVIAQLAQAVGHAHSRGVIHRDLKPQNMILVEHRGHSDVVKVLDFGISKIIAPDYAESIGVTREGEIYGTPGYMAPEQFRGEGDDPRIDIYAMGCVAFELLVGEAPFRGGWGAVMNAVLTTPVTRPSLRCPHSDIPEALDRVILRCLEKDPNRRFQTAAEVLAALRDIPGVATQKPSSGRRSFRFVQDTVLPSVPRAGGFDEEGTDAETQEARSTARDLWDAMDAAPEVSPTGPTSSLPLGEAQSKYQSAVRDLAETLVDQGCSDFQLSIGVTTLHELESELERYNGEMDELEMRSAASEQRAKEREASLRFAIGELRFECDQARARGAPVDASVERQILELEARLAEVAAELESELGAITERGISLAASRAIKEDDLVEHVTSLDRLIEQVIPPFREEVLVLQLQERVRNTRAMVRHAAQLRERRS